MGIICLQDDSHESSRRIFSEINILECRLLQFYCKIGRAVCEYASVGAYTNNEGPDQPTHPRIISFKNKNIIIIIILLSSLSICLDQLQAAQTLIRRLVVSDLDLLCLLRRVRPNSFVVSDLCLHYLLRPSLSSDSIFSINFTFLFKGIESSTTYNDFLSNVP